MASSWPPRTAVTKTRICCYGIALAYLAQLAGCSTTPHAEFAHRGRYFPLQKAIGAEPFGKLHAQPTQDPGLRCIGPSDTPQGQRLARGRLQQDVTDVNLVQFPQRDLPRHRTSLG